jgi:hypothetical protein
MNVGVAGSVCDQLARAIDYSGGYALKHASEEKGIKDGRSSFSAFCLACYVMREARSFLMIAATIAVEGGWKTTRDSVGGGFLTCLYTRLLLCVFPSLNRHTSVYTCTPFVTSNAVILCSVESSFHTHTHTHTSLSHVLLSSPTLLHRNLRLTSCNSPCSPPPSKS